MYLPVFGTVLRATGRMLARIGVAGGWYRQPWIQEETP